jgi:hypothetical protein
MYVMKFLDYLELKTIIFMHLLFQDDFLKYLLKTQIGPELRIWLLQNLLQGFHFQGHKIYMISIEYVINMQTSIQYFYVIAKIAAFLFKRSSRRLYSEKFIFTAR